MNIQTNIQKIKYLRLLSESLKGGWEFEYCNECPCGHLARIVSGLGNKRFGEMIMNDEEHHGLWSMSLGVCQETGRPFSEVVAYLFNAGFTQDEIIDLEEAANQSDSRYSKSYIFSYISSWRSRIISETESQISELDADLKVEVLLSEFVIEKQLA